MDIFLQGLIAVGVGSGVSMNELHSIADDPDSLNTFTVSDYDQLNSIATQIINRACQGINLSYKNHKVSV